MFGFRSQSSSRRLTPLDSALRSCRPAFATVMLVSLCITLLSFATIAFMIEIYGHAITTRSTDSLIALAIIASFFIVIYGFLERLRSSMLVRIGVRIDRQVAPALYDASYDASLIARDSACSGVLRDLDVVREFWTGHGFLAMCDVPWVPLMIALAFALHPVFGFIAIGFSAAIVALTIANEVLTHGNLRRSAALSERASTTSTVTFRNIDAVQSMGMRGALKQLWMRDHDAALAWQAAASHRSGALTAMIRFLHSIVYIFTMGIGAYLAIRGDLPVGTIFAANIAVLRSFGPVEGAVSQWNQFIQARFAFGRIQALFRLSEGRPERISLPRPRGQLDVSDLAISAPGSTDLILRSVSFSLAPGEVLGLIGPSAVGKSSLSRVLVGVWQPTLGSVRLDGAELHHWRTDELGAYLGYLPQQIGLFSGTVAQNIARFGASDDAAIIAAAQLAGAHEMILQLPNGYHTLVGEDGQAISGGQRQRIGLARAVYRTPSLVVLDEPNNGLDSEGEAALIAMIRQLREMGTSVVLITHKVNLLSVVDRVLVLKKGTMQIFGSREDVLKRALGPQPLSVRAPAFPGQPVPELSAP